MPGVKSIDIVDLYYYYVYFTRSGVSRCTLILLLYLGRMSHCGLHVMHWVYIGTPMCLLNEEPHCTTALLFPSVSICGTILVAPYLMMWNWRVSGAGLMPFYWPSCVLPFCHRLFSLSFLSFYKGKVFYGQEPLSGESTTTEYGFNYQLLAVMC